MKDIIKECTAQRNMSKIHGEQALVWSQRVEAQRVQNNALDEMKNVKDFDHIQRGKRTEQ